MLVFHRYFKHFSNELLLWRIRNNTNKQIGTLQQRGQQRTKAWPHKFGQLFGRVNPLTARVYGDYGTVEVERDQFYVQMFD